MADHLIQWRNQQLNTISESFCAAKWFNASIYLGFGFTGSCHHPLPHPIDKEAIKSNPSAIHNTEHKKLMRKMMLEGVKPAECAYCWKVEDMGRNNVSDRIHKSIIYDNNDIQSLKEIPWDADVNLKTLEISFDRQCNFACSYCNAGYSSTWAQDLNKNGAYQNFTAPEGGGGAYQSDGSWAEANGRHLDDNPYTEAFFKWWPELSQTLQEIRITGGEPTVSQNFWRFIDILHENKSLNLRFAVNSNLGMSEKALEKLVKITHTLPVKEFDLFTSNECYGEHAEYVRDGLNYKLWKENLTNFIENAKFRTIGVMMTINNLSLFSLTDFMDDMLTLKSKYGTNKLLLDLNILRWPSFMSVLVLPDEIKEERRNHLKKWLDENKNSVLLDSEKAGIQRVIDYMETIVKGHDNWITTDKTALFHDFKSFYSQYDERRQKNFVKTFPELEHWYNSIKVNKVFEIKPLHNIGITGYEIGEYKKD